MLSPFWFFYKCLFLALIKNGKERKAVSDLFNKFSYRYAIDDTRSLFNPLRYLIKSLKLLYRDPEKYDEDTVFYLIGSERNKLAVKKYLDYIKEPVYPLIFRETITSNFSTAKKVGTVVHLLCLYLIIQLFIVLFKDKSKVSLILLELTEQTALSEILKKNQAKELRIIGAFEKDMYLLSYFLMSELKLMVTLIPSSNPISFYYKNVVCSNFIFTAPFQQYEYNLLKDNWEVNDFLYWPPFGSYNTIKNANISSKSERNTVGFVSSCQELRKHLKHSNSLGYKDYKAEIKLLHFLKKYIEDRSEIKLIVYLHPLEKKNKENLDFSIQYYQNLFGNNFTFAPLEKESKECFNLCDVAISGFSSAQIERLYGGYKTLFAPFEYLENYFKDPRLDAISGTSSEQLTALIEGTMNKTADEFFIDNNLLDYRYDYFKFN